MITVVPFSSDIRSSHESVLRVITSRVLGSKVPVLDTVLKPMHKNNHDNDYACNILVYFPLPWLNDIQEVLNSIHSSIG